MQESVCELCTAPGGMVLHHARHWRVVLVDDAAYPGFCRVVWNDHVKEMTNLPLTERNDLMMVVWRIEAAVREVMQPDKINLASFGNVVPHLHWHVIPRYRDDAHFPNPVWGAVQRVPEPELIAQRVALLPALAQAIARNLGHLP
jgi:diadenosine tetraphosphate (Ap4A) HIT family hydrolase